MIQTINRSIFAYYIGSQHGQCPPIDKSKYGCQIHAMKIRSIFTDPATRCYTITTAIMVAGLVSAAVIYLTAGETPNDPFAEFEKSKKFAYELERMGGKAALVANDLNTWFAGLWQGETLAFTVAVITIIIAAGYYFIATSVEEEARSKSKENSLPGD